MADKLDIPPIEAIKDTSKVRVVTYQGGNLQHAPWPIGTLILTDGVAAPDTVSGQAIIYVDSSGGDLKIKFGDGTVKTIVVDT